MNIYIKDLSLQLNKMDVGQMAYTRDLQLFHQLTSLKIVKGQRFIYILGGLESMKFSIIMSIRDEPIRILDN